MERGVYTTVFVVFAISLSVVHGCTQLDPGVRDPESREGDSLKIYYTEVVLFGKLVRKVSGDNYPYNGIDGVSTVEYNVLCSYKGGDVPSTIYIAGMGNKKAQVPGCPKSPIKINETAIVFLKRTDVANIFEVEFRPNYGDVGQTLDDLTITCGLELTASSDDICQDFEPLTEADGCDKYVPPTTTKATSTTGKPVTTNKTKVIVNDGNNTDTGYETKDNGNAGGEEEPHEKTDKVKGSNDPTGAATILSASLATCLSAIFLTLVNAL